MMGPAYQNYNPSMYSIPSSRTPSVHSKGGFFNPGMTNSQSQDGVIMMAIKDIFEKIMIVSPLLKSRSIPLTPKLGLRQAI